MGHLNLADMFYNRCSKSADRTGMMFKEAGTYKALTFQEINEEVRQIAGGLAALGVKKGDNVIILSENSKEWAFCDYGILTNGAVTVPIYPTLLSSQVKYIIIDSEAKVAIISNREQFEKIQEIESEIPALEKFILIDSRDIQHRKAITLAELKESGVQYLRENHDTISESLKKIGREDLATIIYTSGTTGEPKGVMLSHGNLLSNIEGCLRALPVSEEDVLLSFLPLSHSFERMVGHFLANHTGATIAYAEAIEKVPQNLVEARPTLVASVPRLFEKIYARVVAAAEEGSALKKKLFYWAIGVGREVTGYRQQNQPIPGKLKFNYRIANALVFSKLKKRVGGRIRFFVSGGAPLPQEIGEFFTAAGLLILEGYGLTETSPVISVNRLEKFKFGTVGIPLDNVEVKIADDGEILTRGSHVMQGYYKKEAETREAIDAQGWFYSGDIGLIDEEGFLKITDRKKNIIVTAGGKNVAPQKMENLLVTSRYIEQVLVIGDKRKFCSAVIVPSIEPLETYAREKGVAYNSLKELCNSPKIHQLFETEVATVNQELASFETIKKFILVERPFSIESGELTPSLKIKRKAVEQNYQPEIEAIYAE